jgi:glycosidase
MIYYGDEAGAWGANDPDDRMPMIWRELTYQPQTIDPRGRKRAPDEVKFDDELFAFYKKAIALRRQHSSLTRGDLSILATDDVQRSLAISRRSSNETLIIFLNRGDKEARLNLRLSSSSLKPIFVTEGAIESVKVSPSDVGLSVALPALTGAVLRSEE